MSRSLSNSRISEVVYHKQRVDQFMSSTRFRCMVCSATAAAAEMVEITPGVYGHKRHMKLKKISK